MSGLTRLEGRYKELADILSIARVNTRLEGGYKEDILSIARVNKARGWI